MKKFFFAAAALIQCVGIDYLIIAHIASQPAEPAVVGLKIAYLLGCNAFIIAFCWALNVTTK